MVAQRRSVDNAMLNYAPTRAGLAALSRGVFTWRPPIVEKTLEFHQWHRLAKQKTLGVSATHVFENAALLPGLHADGDYTQLKTSSDPADLFDQSPCTCVTFHAGDQAAVDLQRIGGTT